MHGAAPAPRAWSRAGLLLVAGVFALCAWRAATQAVSHDEALTWLHYLSRPFGLMFTNWQANNHVLHTALAWLSVHAFGDGELALRLPALAGAALYLLAARRLSRLLFGAGPLALLALALLVLNPLLLDLLVTARGYGLALAFLGWAAIVLLSVVEAAAAGVCVPRAAEARASLLLGLCVAANLAFVPAATGLLIATLLATRARPSQAALLLLPGAVLAGALLLPPMWGASHANFIAGVDRLSVAANSLLLPSLVHHPAPWLPDAGSGWCVGVLLPAGRALLALLLLLLLLRSVAWLRAGPAQAADRALAVLGGALLLAVVMLVLLHEVAGLLYPADRTLLWVLPLATLSALLLARRGLSGRWRPAARATLGLLVLLAALYASQLQVSRFALWSADAGARRIFGVVQARQQLIPRRDVRLRVAYRVLAPALQYYQRTRASDWLAPVPLEWDRADLNLDYLVVPAGGWGDILSGDPHRFNLVYEDPVSGVRLAVPKHRTRR